MTWEPVQNNTSADGESSWRHRFGPEQKSQLIWLILAPLLAGLVFALLDHEALRLYPAEGTVLLSGYFGREAPAVCRCGRPAKWTTLRPGEDPPNDSTDEFF